MAEPEIVRFLRAQVAADLEAVIGDGTDAMTGQHWKHYPQDAYDAIQKITLWTCARVRDESMAKLKLIEDFTLYADDYRTTPSDYAAGRRHMAMLALIRAASVYETHPDFNPEWKA